MVEIDFRALFQFTKKDTVVNYSMNKIDINFR